MRFGALVLMVLACSACASAGPRPFRMSANDGRAEITAGTMARIRLASNLMVSGQLVQSGADSVALTVPSGERQAFPALEVRDFRIQGTRTNSGTGALIGLFIGGLAGAVLGAATGETCGLDAYSTCSTGSSAAGGALVLGAIGAGMGALLGRIRTNTWVSVPGPWRVVQ